ncbi:MAG: 50S ribosomal protein L24 [Gammaproteobacteria bacterium]|nr:50S ribosomal protein L24 [Gammaproteobacteria bacterium]MDE2345075.1 50S ribosomal protein L24 [Gammaproteobacteria bacterium]
MKKIKIKKGDEVVVTGGKDKGRRGAVLKVLSKNQVVVENINMVKKHVRPNPNAGVTGGIVDKEMPIHISKVMLFNPVTKKGDRAGYRKLDDGRKVRFFRSNNEVVDV